MNNTIKFVATDMDGSLLNDNKQLPDDFHSVFEALHSRDILFAAASGRQYASLLHTFDAIKDRMLFIADNGALVMHQGKELHSSTIDKNSIHEILARVQTIDDCYIVLCGKGTAYINTKDEQAITEMRKYYATITYVEDLFAVEDEFIKVAVLNFHGTEEHVWPVVEPLFSNSHQVVVSAFIWLDFMEKSASKGTAIKHLQTVFDFTYEQSISFGDYFNDIEMLKETHHSYAMENAHPEIKKLARFIAPSNNDGGVTKVIKEKVLAD